VKLEDPIKEKMFHQKFKNRISVSHPTLLEMYDLSDELLIFFTKFQIFEPLKSA